MKQLARVVLATIFGAVPVLMAADGMQGVEPAGTGQTSHTARITMPAMTNYRNCLKGFDLTIGGSVATFRVLSNGATVYAVDLSSGGGAIREWDWGIAPCTPAVNQIMELYVDAGAYKLSVSTFTRK